MCVCECAVLGRAGGVAPHSHHSPRCDLTMCPSSHSGGAPGGHAAGGELHRRAQDLVPPPPHHLLRLHRPRQMMRHRTTPREPHHDGRRESTPPADPPTPPHTSAVAGTSPSSEYSDHASYRTSVMKMAGRASSVEANAVFLLSRETV